MTVAELNAGDGVQFVAAVGWVFEHSPWVAERAWTRRPFVSLDALHAAMVMEVTRASWPEQLALLRAHPDLGARVGMSAASTTEQAGAGLDRMAADEFEELQRLNTVYRETFGFPFLFAVRGSTARDILTSLRTRVQAMPEAERAEALRHVSRIAYFRLHDAISR